jgi:hypothetical protein
MEPNREGKFELKKGFARSNKVKPKPPQPPKPPENTSEKEKPDGKGKLTET